MRALLEGKHEVFSRVGVREEKDAYLLRRAAEVAAQAGAKIESVDAIRGGWKLAVYAFGCKNVSMPN